jgi:glutamyl-tRNA reductase
LLDHAYGQEQRTVPGATPVGQHDSTKPVQSTFRITSASFAHPATTAEQRAALALSSQQLHAGFSRLRAEGIDAFVLHTCLRVEVVTTGCERALGRAQQILFPGIDLPATGAIRRDADALAHLSRIAAGLDSPVVGEPEVLGQYRAALEAAQAAGAVGGLFEKALQATVKTARQARRQMAKVSRGSIALVAADLVRDADRVAIFGAGAMARAAAGALRSGDEMPKISIYARRPEAVDFDADDVRPLRSAPEALAEFPAVISASAAKAQLFDADVLATALERRAGTLLLIDLAMPPDFAPGECNGSLEYVNIDDLAAQIQRDGSGADVEQFVAAAAIENWAKLSNHQRVGPVIAAILDEADRAVAEEVRRFAGRLNGPDADDAVLRQLAQTVAHRVLHRPLSYLGTSENGAEAAGVLAEVFGVAGDG